MIREKTTPKEIIIDLTGPSSNAFALIGHTQDFAKQLGYSKEDKTDQPTDHSRYEAVNESISSILNRRKIKYTVEMSEYDGLLIAYYDIFMGSYECYIEVSESPNKANVTFHDSGDDSQYEKSEDIINPSEWDPETSLNALFEFIRKKAKAESKIAAYVEKIEAICEECDLSVDDYITVLKSFD